jgi:hypothetical protein
MISLLLRSPDGPRRAGEALPVEVELRNDGDDELWIVGVVGGSEEGVRYPRYRPSITKAGEVVGEPPPPEDPLVAPLRAADFKCLSPGEPFDPTTGLPLSTFANFRPPETGIYRYTLELSTESERPEQWLGSFGQDEERSGVLELIARVPRLTVRSNVLDVEVR